MRNRTKVITFSSMLIALTVIFMYIGTIFPSGRIGFMAVASLFAVAAVIQYGFATAAGVFVVSAILGFLIIPDKTPILFYILFFGYYPIVKSVSERLKNSVIGWIIKLIVFNIALTVMFSFFRELLMLSFLKKLTDTALGVVIYIVFNAVFVLYDIGLSRLIGLYMVRIHGKLK